MRKILLALLLLVVSNLAVARPIQFRYIKVIAPHNIEYKVISLDVDDKNNLRGVFSNGVASCPDCWDAFEFLASISKENGSIRIIQLDVYGNPAGMQMSIGNPALFGILTLVDQGVL